MRIYNYKYLRFDCTARSDEQVEPNGTVETGEAGEAGEARHLKTAKLIDSPREGED